MSNIAADSAVAQFVSSQSDFCKRKDFAPATGKPDFDNTMAFFEEDAYYKAKPPSPPETNGPSTATLDDPKFLRLDLSKLPLETFDAAEFLEKDKSPEEWLEVCPSGSAAKFDGKEWKWRKVRVDSYDKTTVKYNITFLPSKQTKQVSRLNLLFDSEDKVFWERRRNEATKLRNDTKQRLRFDHFVSQQVRENVQAYPTLFLTRFAAHHRRKACTEGNPEGRPSGGGNGPPHTHALPHLRLPCVICALAEIDWGGHPVLHPLYEGCHRQPPT